MAAWFGFVGETAVVRCTELRSFLSLRMMRGAAESDPYPLMRFVVVVYSFSHSSSDHSRKKHLFFSSGFHHTKFDSSPLLSFFCVLFLSSSLTHSVLHSHTHTVAVQKFFTLSRSHLPQISKESKFRSLSLSRFRTPPVLIWGFVCVCVSSTCTCVYVFSFSRKEETHF